MFIYDCIILRGHYDQLICLQFKLYDFNYRLAQIERFENNMVQQGSF